MNYTTRTPIKDTLDQFREVLFKAHAITSLDVCSHWFLRELAPGLGPNMQKLLYIFLSLLNDGNTCYALDVNILNEKWKTKWDGLCRLSAIDGTQLIYSSEDFRDVIDNGIREILKDNEMAEPLLFDKRDKITPRDEITRPFVICRDKTGIPWCYAAKYFDAKCVIEDKISKLFGQAVHTNDTNANVDVLLAGTMLREKQKEAIRRGIHENLIITGGPGTGKTTVVCYLLWCLLKLHPETQLYKIYLAAPSGKAADRMRESIAETIVHIPGDPTDPIKSIIANLESCTIHRLLKYKPDGHAFAMNANHPFSPDSIFIIDEASMIDLALFASLIAAIPEGARLFILGDPDQLPSVDAGAVLGDLLNAKGNFVVKLLESNRFDDQSKIGKFAHSIRNISATSFERNIDKVFWGTPKDDELYHINRKNVLDKMHFIQMDDISDESSKDTTEQIRSIVSLWTERFYAPLLDLANAINPDNELESQQEKLDKLWFHATLACILSAERSGKTGVELLNLNACTCLNPKRDPSELFAGRLMMLTRNQTILKLYNGDSGVVLRSERDGQFYLLLKKPHHEGDKHLLYVKYPMSMLPSDAIEDAFAITVHKSQGSGYPHVMVFLPTHVGHPLLNCQIVYTAVTRTMGQSLSIVSNQDCFRDACHRLVKRDTGIVL